MKVLHVINGLHPGGAETLLYYLVTRPSHVEHEVICLGPRGWYSAAFEELGVRLHHLGMSGPLSTLAQMGKLRRLVVESRAHVIQAWLYRSNVLAGFVAKTLSVPCVWGIHCSSLDPLGWGSKLWAKAGGRTAGLLAAHVINCSRRSAEIHQRLGYGAAPVTVIPNGYDPAVFSPDTDARRSKRAQLCASGFLIGMIGRWHRQKDLPNLLLAVRLAIDGGVALRCLVVGEGLGPDNASLTRLITDAGLSGTVIPLGPRRHIVDIERSLDLHVLPSSGAEAFPNVVAETMLCCTPNAVTNVGDSAYIVGDTGWVVPPNNPTALAKAIGDAYHEFREAPESWRTRRVAARERVAENFSMDRMATAYECVWRSVVEKAVAKELGDG